MLEAEIEVKAEVEKLDSVDITIPDTSSVKQLDDSNMMEVLQTAMGNLYQKCPNILQFIAGLTSSGDDDGEWD